MTALLGIEFTSVLRTIMYVVFAILFLLLHILIHELGHYTAARLVGMKVKEFAIGFGPSKWSLKRVNKRGERWSLRLFPLGGFCAFYDEETDGSTEYSFNSYPPWKRIIVFIAGGLFNLLSAVIFAFIMLMIVGYGIPKITAIEPASPNAEILKVNDIVIEVDGKKLSAITSMSEILNKIDEGVKIDVTVRRDGEVITLSGVQKYTFKDEDGKEYSDIAQWGGVKVNMGVGESLLYSVPYTADMTWEMLTLFGKLVTGRLNVMETLSGPVRNIELISSYMMLNWRYIFLLLPLIAINLGIFNLMPIPALDGAKVVFTLIEWIRRKPINRNVEAYIHFGGLILLLGLVIVIDLVHYAGLIFK